MICIAHEETWVGWEVRRGKKGQPALMKTAFGWTVAGVSGKKSGKSAAISWLSSDDRGLKENVGKIFMNDFPVIADNHVKMSKEAEEANRQLEE